MDQRDDWGYEPTYRFRWWTDGLYKPHVLQQLWLPTLSPRDPKVPEPQPEWRQVPYIYEVRPADSAGESREP